MNLHSFIADAPFFAFLATVALLFGVRTRMNKVILAHDGVTYGLSRQREMMNHYRTVAGPDTNYRFYRFGLVAAPVLVAVWALLSSLVK